MTFSYRQLEEAWKEIQIEGDQIANTLDPFPYGVGLPDAQLSEGFPYLESMQSQAQSQAFAASNHLWVGRITSANMGLAIPLPDRAYADILESLKEPIYAVMLEKSPTFVEALRNAQGLEQLQDLVGEAIGSGAWGSLIHVVSSIPAIGTIASVAITIGKLIFNELGRGGARSQPPTVVKTTYNPARDSSDFKLLQNRLNAGAQLKSLMGSLGGYGGEDYAQIESLSPLFLDPLFMPPGVPAGGGSVNYGNQPWQHPDYGNGPFFTATAMEGGGVRINPRMAGGRGIIPGGQGTSHQIWEYYGGRVVDTTQFLPTLRLQSPWLFDAVAQRSGTMAFAISGARLRDSWTYYLSALSEHIRSFTRGKLKTALLAKGNEMFGWGLDGKNIEYSIPVVTSRSVAARQMALLRRMEVAYVSTASAAYVQSKRFASQDPFAATVQSQRKLFLQDDEAVCAVNLADLPMYTKADYLWAEEIRMRQEAICPGLKVGSTLSTIDPSDRTTPPREPPPREKLKLSRKPPPRGTKPGTAVVVGDLGGFLDPPPPPEIEPVGGGAAIPLPPGGLPPGGVGVTPEGNSSVVLGMGALFVAGGILLLSQKRR